MRTCIVFLAACIAAFGNAEQDKAAKDALDAFKKAYASKEESARVAAVTPLGEVAHPSVVRILAGLVASDTDSVRLAAVEALGKMKDRRDVAPALAAGFDVNKGHDKVESAIIVALGETNDPSAPAVLKSIIDKEGNKKDAEDQDDVKEAIKAIGKLRWKTSVDVLIQLLVKSGSSASMKPTSRSYGKSRSNPIAKEAETALKGLVGAQGNKASEWQSWWNANQGQYDDQLNQKK